MIINQESNVAGNGQGTNRAINALTEQTSTSLANLTNLAALALQVPVAFILQRNTNWQLLATHGLPTCTLPINTTHPAINQSTDAILVSESGQNQSAWHTLLTDLGIEANSFACCQLPAHEKNSTLWLVIADSKNREFTTRQLELLEGFARQANDLLQHHTTETAAKHVESEELQAIFEYSIDAIFILNERDEIIQWNPKAEQLFGWETSKILNKSFVNTLLTNKSKKLVSPMLAECRTEACKVAKTIEVTAKRRDKSRLEIDLGVSAANIKNTTHLICFANDITDRKTISKELDKQKHFYENILNHIPCDIAVFDQHHRYLFVNPGAIQNPELRKYIIGKDDFEYAQYRKRDTKIPELRRLQFDSIKNTRKEIRWEENLTDNEGNTKTHLRRLFPVSNANGELEMVIGYGLDVTDLRLMEEKQLALKQLAAQNKQLTDFCNIVSHNLRGPLVNMQMLVQHIEESEDEEDRKLLLAKLNPVIENLHTTFNELVETIQVKQNFEVEFEEVQLEECLRKTIESFEIEISSNHAQIEYDFKEAPIVHFPVKYLNSILHNLISNALKYRSPERNPHIIIKSKTVNEHVQLSVKDNGLGIDLEKHKDNIFKIGKVFHRTKNSKGFGLHMTKTQIEAMDGKIWVESKPDNGATFYIEFPNQNQDE